MNNMSMAHSRANKIENKSKKSLKSIVKLLKYIKPYRWFIILAIIFACLSTASTIVTPKLIGNITNIIQENIMTSITTNTKLAVNLSKIAYYGIIIVICIVLSAALNYIQGLIFAKITAKVYYKLRKDISIKINKLPIKYIDKQSHGDILSRVTNDVDTISQTLSDNVSTLFSSIVTVIGVLIMMFTISWQMTLVALITVPLGIIMAGTIMKFSQKYFVMQQNSLGKLNGHIEEVYSNHNVVKVFNACGKEKITFSKYNKMLAKAGYKSYFLSGLMMPIMMFIGNIGYLAVCVVGGSLAINGIIMIGAIQSFIIYIRQFNHPLQQIASISATLQSTAAATERVFEILDEPEQENEDNKTLEIKDIQGNVEFKNVNFGYDKKKQIIYDFSCDVKSGQKVAIVGPTGAGKTTLVNLLMRFYEIDSGEILIDGINTKDIKRENIRKLFGMVLQDSWLFEGTIKENLKFGKPEATDEEVIEACKAANIHHFITTLPGGYDYVLGDEASLSQGQRQLLTIARAILQNAPMLILDEATSNVDTRTEILIQEAMDNLMKNRTSFIIAHRLSTIKNADLILVLKDGNVIEKGNHEELIKQNGFYASLYNSQFEDY